MTPPAIQLISVPTGDHFCSKLLQQTPTADAVAVVAAAAAAAAQMLGQITVHVSSSHAWRRDSHHHGNAA